MTSLEIFNRGFRISDFQEKQGDLLCKDYIHSWVNFIPFQKLRGTPSNDGTVKSMVAVVIQYVGFYAEGSWFEP